MPQDPAFHLIYTARDFCGVQGCKWCAAMKPWIERDQKRDASKVVVVPKLDVHAPEFVPASAQAARPTEEIYSTPKQSKVVHKGHTSNGFLTRFKSSSSTRSSSPESQLQDLLGHLAGLEDGDELQDPFELGRERVKLGPLLQEDSRAAIDFMAWQLATETFNETLVECVPRLVQYSGRLFADKAIKRINECEDIILKTGQEAIETMMRLAKSGYDYPQLDALLDMRLDTIAAVLQMKQEEVRIMQVAKARARAEEHALQAEMENTCHIFDVLENQLAMLHAEAARLRIETAELRAAF